MNDPLCICNHHASEHWVKDNNGGCDHVYHDQTACECLKSREQIIKEAEYARNQSSSQ